MILRERPDLGHRSSREAFVERLMVENCVIVARTAQAVLPALDLPVLSLHAVWGGTEEHTIGDRRMRVDDDGFLLASPNNLHSSTLRTRRPVQTLAIYFRRGLPEAILDEPHSPLQSQPRSPEEEQNPEPGLVFHDQLVAHDTLITPVLRYIAATASEGFQDEAWFEEQLVFLLQRLGEVLQRAHDRQTGFAVLRPVRRGQLLRRIARARDFILSNYDRPLTLLEMAEAAHLSRFHFARVFRQVAGVSPYTFLQRKRAAVAQRLLRTTDLPLDEISRRCGMTNRSTIYRLCRQFRGQSPRRLRAGLDDGGVPLLRLADGS